jgi:transcriptional regulator with XRE-family HTH domain
VERNWIRGFRKRLGLSQQQFATRLNSAISAIAKYEAGRVPDASVLLRLMILAAETGNHPFAEHFRTLLHRQAQIPHNWRIEIKMRKMPDVPGYFQED